MSNKAIILVLEDDTSVRLTLTELLSLFGFECMAVEHGVEGFEMLQSVTPDLIICDVNMPLMGGNEFTSKLKTKPEFAHIPVIMLTANTAEEDMLKGLSSGAVDYIKKPFNSNELVLKINNILHTKRAYDTNSWKAVLSNTFEQNPNLDEQFVSDLYALIVENLEYASYSVQQLSEDMNLSERNLYRKVKEHIGMPVATFIREVKLQRAHDLLSNKKLGVWQRQQIKLGLKVCLILQSCITLSLKRLNKPPEGTFC